MPEEGTQHDAVREAREEGVFQGKILTTLTDIKQTLEVMRNKHAEQDAKIERKADREEFKELSKKVEELQKKAYIGIGALAMIQIVLALVLR